jgi:DNA-binding winged helix-turn-helix (wHTH) protein
MRVQIGELLFDGETRDLKRGGAPVHVSPKVFRLLELLLESRPKAVAKEGLIQSLWPGTFVAEGNLARLVAELREAVGDDARKPTLIRTIHGFGYALVGQAPAQADVVFRLVLKDREIALEEGENVLGREPDAAAWIDVHSVSRRHARIVVRDGEATLEDLGSKNGTFLRGEAVTAPRALADGDRIRIGTVEMTLRRFTRGVSTESALRP